MCELQNCTTSEEVKELSKQLKSMFLELYPETKQEVGEATEALEMFLINVWDQKGDLMEAYHQLYRAQDYTMRELERFMLFNDNSSETKAAFRRFREKVEEEPLLFDQMLSVALRIIYTAVKN